MLCVVAMLQGMPENLFQTKELMTCNPGALLYFWVLRGLHRLPSANDYYLWYTCSDTRNTDAIPHSINTKTQHLVPLLMEPGCIRNLRCYIKSL